MRVTLLIWGLVVGGQGLLCPAKVLGVTPAEKPKFTSPFDPLKLMATPPVPEKEQPPDKLTARSIYRIEGVRFQRFSSLEGVVFIESPSSVPDFERGRVLCKGEMNPSWEVIRIRDEVEMTPDVTNHAKTILSHIESCAK